MPLFVHIQPSTRTHLCTHTNPSTDTQGDTHKIRVVAATVADAKACLQHKVLKRLLGGEADGALAHLPPPPLNLYRGHHTVVQSAADRLLRGAQV